jgi:hypothetical protein
MMWDDSCYLLLLYSKLGVSVEQSHRLLYVRGEGLTGNPVVPRSRFTGEDSTPAAAFRIPQSAKRDHTVSWENGVAGPSSAKA